MPTYSYVCRDCGHAFDVQQAFTDDALTTCPACEGTLRKVFSAVGVVFKGSGFYRTDSRGSGSSPSTAKSSESSSDKGAGTSGGTADKKSSTSSTAAASSTSAASSSTPSTTTSSSSTAGS